MKRLSCFALGAALVLTGCVAPVGPVEVTRFHAPELIQTRGTIEVQAAPGMDGTSLAFRPYAAAVAKQLGRLGYREVAGGSSSSQVAIVRISRDVWRPERQRSPVSVGVGGSTGSYGSGLGLGLGLNLSGRPKEQVQTELSVRIQDRASQKSVWEGRAAFTVRADSPMADTALGAEKLAEALFKDFPGNSGESILVKPDQ